MTAFDKVYTSNVPRAFEQFDLLIDSKSHGNASEAGSEDLGKRYPGTGYWSTFQGND